MDIRNLAAQGTRALVPAFQGAPLLQPLGGEGWNRVQTVTPDHTR
jgi:hypothetical protein